MSIVIIRNNKYRFNEYTKVGFSYYFYGCKNKKRIKSQIFICSQKILDKDIMLCLCLAKFELLYSNMKT